MFLYHLTLQQPTAITATAIGNFSGAKQQEIVIARNSVLELIRPDPQTGKVHSLVSREVFGIIRSIVAFRLTGGSKGTSLPGCVIALLCLHLSGPRFAYIQLFL